ncbi:hypothetical protein M1D46_01575 [Microbacterium sp. JZ70]
MTRMIAVEIAPVTLPDTVDARDARDFLDYLEVAATVMREQSGAGVGAQKPADALERLRGATCVPLLARIAGRAAGAAQFMAPADGGALASISVFVPRRDAGILEAMLIKAVEEQARAHWFAAVRAVSLHRPDTEGDVIPAADGGEAAPRDPQARALAESGYALETVTRHPTGWGDLEYLAAEWRKDLAA